MGKDVLWLGLLPLAIVLFATFQAPPDLFENIVGVIAFYVIAAALPIALLSAFYIKVVRPRDAAALRKRKERTADKTGYWK